MTDQIQEKKVTLVGEYQLTDLDGHPIDPRSSIQNRSDKATSSSQWRKRRRIRPHIELRALMWRMGVDCLATTLEEVRDRTDVVVDSVTRPVSKNAWSRSIHHLQLFWRGLMKSFRVIFSLCLLQALLHSKHSPR
jgi:hypothetical protein